MRVINKYLLFLIVSSISVLLSTSLFAGDTPSMSDIKKSVLKPELTKYGEVIDIEKTNGEATTADGVQAYRIYYRAKVRLNNQWHAVTFWRFNKIDAIYLYNDRDTASLMKSGCETNKNTDKVLGCNTSVKIPEGRILTGEGTVTFKKTEKGWLETRTTLGRKSW